MLHKRVTTETRSNSETKIWHWKNSTLLKAKYQYLTRLVYTSEVSIGSFVCCCQKKTYMYLNGYAHVIKLLQLKRVKLRTYKFTLIYSKVKPTSTIATKLQTPTCHTRTAAANYTKRQWKNRLHTYPSAATVTKSTSWQRKILKII